jgi:cytochrome c oxidase assembly factor 2
MIVTADGQQIQRIRRKRRKDPNMLEQDGASIHLARPQSSDEEVSTFLQMEEEAERLANTRRECPVPKPKGVLGELLGFPTAKGKQNQPTLGTESVTAPNQGG